MKENREGKKSVGGRGLAIFNRVVRKDPDQVNLSKDLNEQICMRKRVPDGG